jgi:hypothetical protein
MLDTEFWSTFGKHVVQAGGSVCEAVHEPLGRKTLETSSFKINNRDTDLFLHGLKSHEEAVNFTEKLLTYLLERVHTRNRTFDTDSDEVWHTLIEMSPNAVNFTVVKSIHDDAPYLPVARIQVVMRLFADIAQVLLYFDIAPARFAYDGVRIYATEAALYASSNGAYPLEPALFTFPRRVYKYKERGFWALVPFTTRFCKCYATMCMQTSEKLRAALPAFNLASIIALQVLTARCVISRSCNPDDTRDGMEVDGARIGGGPEGPHYLSTILRNVMKDKVEQPVSGGAECAHSLLTMMSPCIEHNKHCGCMDPLTWLMLPHQLKELEKLSANATWDVFAYCPRQARFAYFPSKPSAANSPQYIEALRDSRRWKLDAPLVNMANDDDADFLTPHVQSRSGGWDAPRPSKYLRST